jgi:hypothetical protein
MVWFQFCKQANSNALVWLLESAWNSLCRNQNTAASWCRNISAFITYLNQVNSPGMDTLVSDFMGSLMDVITKEDRIFML